MVERPGRADAEDVGAGLTAHTSASLNTNKPIPTPYIAIQRHDNCEWLIAAAPGTGNYLFTWRDRVF
jgi:hypothetical protein